MKSLKAILNLTLGLLLVQFLLPAGVFSSEHTWGGQVRMHFDLSSHEKGKVVQLWIPYPVSNQFQLISNIKIRGNHDYAAVFTEPRMGNSILYVRWNQRATSRQLDFSFDITRKERIDTPRITNTEPCWARDDYKKWLSATGNAPLSTPVKELAQKITKGKDSVGQKALAIYNWVISNMYRDETIRGCGAGRVCILLKRMGGKCVDIHSVFVALCRAAGVPAREVFGLRMAKDGPKDITHDYHCWAEFHLPGQGWIVVDPADVLKAILKEHLAPDGSKVTELKRYYFGKVDPYRIRLTLGRDIMLNPPQSGPPLNYFMYPFAQVGKREINWLRPETFRYQIIFSPNRSTPQRD